MDKIKNNLLHELDHHVNPNHQHDGEKYEEHDHDNEAGP